MKRDKYPLRPLDLSEIARLQHQHQVWRESTDEVLRAAGFGAGDRVLDLGCGPGFVSRDLAETVGEKGSVLALDSSVHFVAYLRQEARKRGLDQVRAEVGDARELDLPPGSLDAAFCRWLLMFVSEPERVAAGVARALRPGGVFAVMEYAQFRSTSLWPEGPCFRSLYDKVYALIGISGGDADIGGRVPSLLVEAGFEIERLIPFWRVGGPGSPEWQWLERTHPNHVNLVAAGLVTEDELEAYYREWEAAFRNPASIFTAPPVLATIARKL